MTERPGRYIVKVGNVIHGVFPKPPERPMIPDPDRTPYEVSYQAQPVQKELNLTGGSSSRSWPREDAPRLR